MFSKTIIDSDLFLDMPTSTRLLYFDLSMRADDDGFVNSPKKIIRMTGASEDDLRILISKNFIIPFESGVVVIKHWKIHNYIRKDRYKPTMCIDEKQQLGIKNSEYVLTDGIPVVNQMETQDRLGKDRLGNSTEESLEPEIDRINYQQIADMYNNTCVSFPKLVKLSNQRKKAIRARLKSGYTVEDFQVLFEMAEESDFLKGKNKNNWSATFDWLIKDSNMAKVLDGNYKNREGENSGSSRQNNRPDEVDKPKKHTDGYIQRYIDSGGVVPEFEGF